MSIQKTWYSKVQCHYVHDRHSDERHPKDPEEPEGVWQEESEGARSREDLCEEGFTSEELSRGMKAEEGGDSEEKSDSSQL